MPRLQVVLDRILYPTEECRLPSPLTEYGSWYKMLVPMAKSHRHIDSELARRIRLVVTDVDGTLTRGSDSLKPAVSDAVHRFEEGGVMVGFASGRTLPRLESLALDLGISGPIIAENGGVAKLNVESDLLDLGYSCKPAIEALSELKTLYQNGIEEIGDNRYRLVDVALRCRGIDREELRQHLKDVELLDSGYLLHLVQKGVSKGGTLIRILGRLGDGRLTPGEVMVFGDSLTDWSLFQVFQNSVVIANPELAPEHGEMLRQVATYASDLPFGDGFAQVAFHILDCRLGSEPPK